jgi:hypothetical protein
MKTLLLLTAFCLLTTLPVYSQNQTILRLADDYAAVLKRYETRKSRASLEPVIRAGKAVANRLGELENLSESDYALVEKKMRGFVINRIESVYVEPDAKFFSQLAARRGTLADAEFFRLLSAIKPDNVWAVYIEQQTDVTGCTIYGKGLLVKYYADLLAYQKKYPKSYTDEINGATSDIINKLSGYLCACGDRESVLREFRLFMKTFPRDRDMRLVKQKLAEIKQEKDVRFNCQSG